MSRFFSDRSLFRKSETIFWHIECRFFDQSSTNSGFHIWSITRLPTEQTSLTELLSRFQRHLSQKYRIVDDQCSHPDLVQLKLKNFFRNSQLSVYTENFGVQRKQRGKYEKKNFETMIDLFRDRTFIEYPVLFISLLEDEHLMNQSLGTK